VVRPSRLERRSLGPAAALVLQAGCAATAVLASMALRETAPRKIKNPAQGRNRFMTMACSVNLMPMHLRALSP